MTIVQRLRNAFGVKYRAYDRALSELHVAWQKRDSVKILEAEIRVEEEARAISEY